MSVSQNAGKHLVNAGSKKLAKKGIAAFDPLEAIRMVAAAYSEYKKIRETELAKRQEIRSWEKINVEKIRTQRELLMRYLDLSFDERKQNFSRMFDVLDRCVENGAMESIALTLRSLIDMASSGPFKELATSQSVRELLADPSRDIEI